MWLWLLHSPSDSPADISRSALTKLNFGFSFSVQLVEKLQIIIQFGFSGFRRSKEIKSIFIHKTFLKQSIAKIYFDCFTKQTLTTPYTVRLLNPRRFTLVVLRSVAQIMTLPPPCLTVRFIYLFVCALFFPRVRRSPVIWQYERTGLRYLQTPKFAEGPKVGETA